jgi:YVTN family beta-propeller protein
MVIGTIPLGAGASPIGVAVSPAGARLYVANGSGNTVSVVDTATNTVIGTIPTAVPFGLSVNDDGKIYVANVNSNTVSVINTCSNNKVIATIPVGTNSFAFGTFIQSSETLGGCLRRGH